MEALIHISKIWALMEEKDRRGKLKRFSFQYAKKNGELVNYKDAEMTTIHSIGATVNIKVNDEIKTFRKICFMRFNEFKVYI